MSDLIDRQVAIDALARMMPRSYTPDGSHPADEEIFRAQEVFADCIEALEILPSAQPATNCSEIPNGSDDTISRQAAIDALDEIEAEVADGYGYQYAKWREYFVEMPPAQPQRMRGKWTYGEDEYGIDGYHCDKCGFFVPLDYTHKFIDFIKDFDFCPNCGAPKAVQGQA